MVLQEDIHSSQPSFPVPGLPPDGDPREQAVLWFSWAAGIVLGSMIGADQVLKGYAQRGPRNVVITGSTRGLGKALAREFFRAGHNVVVKSRM